MPIPTLLLLLAIAIALGLLSPKHLGARCDWQPVPAQNYPAASRLAQALARRYRESPALGAIPARTASGAIAAAVLRGRA
ncbi:MAG: hypothetical protein BRC50_14905 [Cyanobacteria bacterium SW_11_48_12]|nr:MAG: hypothetical protein BRC50_14905 [Cyanobacteria bacterium SW_11_48_12]